MSAYFEKLKDPRWQRRRLEILNRDNWTCQLCRATDKTLHVHHWKYIWGREPWDVPTAFLVTLCNTCHEGEADRKVSEETLLWCLRQQNISSQDVAGIANALSKLTGLFTVDEFSWMIDAITSDKELRDLVRTRTEAYCEFLFGASLEELKATGRSEREARDSEIAERSTRGSVR